MTDFKMNMLMFPSCMNTFLMKNQKAALLQIKLYMSGTSKIKLQTCLLMNGFKSEYQVGVSILILSLFDDLYAIVNASYCMIYKSLGSVNYIIDRAFLEVSSIPVWNQENFKTRLKIDTPPFTRVCIWFFFKYNYIYVDSNIKHIAFHSRHDDAFSNHRWSFTSHFKDPVVGWRRLYQCKLHRSKDEQHEKSVV